MLLFLWPNFSIICFNTSHNIPGTQGERKSYKKNIWPFFFLTREAKMRNSYSQRENLTFQIKCKIMNHINSNVHTMEQMSKMKTERKIETDY